jgi:cbb3-type cytochrome c oxidase subunit III
MPRSRNRFSRRSTLGAAVAVAAAALIALPGCELQQTADTNTGMELFTAKCGACHALRGAGTTANVGPNLDLAFQQARAAGMDQDTIQGVVANQIENPRPSSPDNTKTYMPADLYTGQDAKDVAAYVASVAGVPGIQPPQFVASQFFTTNCGSCHTLKAAGTTATVGPNLDDALPGMSAAEIKQSITDPGAKITPGFPAGVMPTNFGDNLTSSQLNQLVAYLMQSVGSAAKK